MKESTLFVFAKVTPKPEFLSEAREAVLGLLGPTRAESGCHQFVLHDGDGDGCLYLYEEWASSQALAEHYDQPYTKAVFEQYRGWLAAPVEITKMRRSVSD